MAGLSTGLKTLLTISPCTVTKGKITAVEDTEAFKVMLNPPSYTRGYTINSTASSKKKPQSKKGPMGGNESPPKYVASAPQKIGFDLVIDGTGVVNLPIPILGSPDVKAQIADLIKVVYTYDGKAHSPNPVRVLWGSLVFFGVLESISFDYTLFKPSGAPLRAKVKLAFTEFQTLEEGVLKANTSSPDLDHMVEVKAGDTLPLLCHEIYRDAGYYPAVAKVNNLVNFRNLVPGTRLRFPPLR